MPAFREQFARFEESNMDSTTHHDTMTMFIRWLYLSLSEFLLDHGVEVFDLPMAEDAALDGNEGSDEQVVFVSYMNNALTDVGGAEVSMAELVPGFHKDMHPMAAGIQVALVIANILNQRTIHAQNIEILKRLSS